MMAMMKMSEVILFPGHDFNNDHDEILNEMRSDFFGSEAHQTFKEEFPGLSDEELFNAWLIYLDYLYGQEQKEQYAIPRLLYTEDCQDCEKNGDRGFFSPHQASVWCEETRQKHCRCAKCY